MSSESSEEQIGGFLKQAEATMVVSESARCLQSPVLGKLGEAPMPTDTYPKRTDCLPRLPPCSSLIKASGAAAKPSAMVSR